MLQKELQSVFEKVQSSTSCHQKCVIILTNLYKKTQRERFVSVFLKFLYHIISQSTDDSIYVKRTLNFISKFCADITKKEEKENETHEFLTALMEQALKWGSLDIYDIRYNSCYLIATVLQDIGEEVQLELNLIDEIQNVLLERMQEMKIPIRVIAMSALVRLQDPHSFECPVIKAYMQALSSGSANIRKDAIQHIAPNMLTLCKIRDRVRDVDPTVRSAAFRKCADIGPLNFRIADKHLILLCGFKETNEKVKNTFFEYLLPKWLTAYRGDYLKFVGALKLIADEDDIKKMTKLSKKLIEEFYNKHPIDNLIQVLPINNEKLINVEHLSNEVTLFWNILTTLLRDSDNMDEYLERILPELTPFCRYIENVIKIKSAEKMDEWKHFEYQYDLLNLFEIAENYDYSDEVGRNTMQSLSTTLLQNNNFTYKLTKKLIVIAQKCSSNVEFFTNDMCQLISEIREPLMEEPLSENKIRERNFRIAELKVKINILKERQTEAINVRDYIKAQELDNELMNINKQLEVLQSHLDVDKVRVAKVDTETLCRCLNILSSVLEFPVVSKLTPSLVASRDNFLVPLIVHQDAEVHWRVLKCLGLFAVIDKNTAMDYAKVICIPIATYRTIPVHNVSALLQSISIIPDLISIYGVELVSPGEEVANTTSDQNGKRRLYTTESEEENSLNIDNMTLSYIFEFFLDMLDDEREEICHKAILAISSLVAESFPVTPTLISRIILKWYSPLTEKQDSRLQVCLGLFIDQYVHSKNAGQTIKEAIIPTLNSIARAPRTSPLADIDLDNVLMFFSEIINITLQKDDLRILALDFFMKISENTSDRIVQYLAKCLCHLDIQQTDAASMTELIERAEILLETMTEKVSRKHIEKFLSKLKQQSAQITIDTTKQTNESTRVERNDSKTTENDSETLSEESTKRLQKITSNNHENEMKEPQQVKRRKSRTRKNKTSKNCVVLLERLNLAGTEEKKHDETTLHTIVEDSMEMEVDDNLSVVTVTSGSSKSSTRDKVVVISETSDSDFSNENYKQKTTRSRKKRII